MKMKGVSVREKARDSAPDGGGAFRVIRRSPRTRRHAWGMGDASPVCLLFFV